MVLPARSRAVVTIDEFLRLRLPDGKAELVRGEVRVTPPAGGPHGVAASNLIHHLSVHVRQHRLGSVFGEGLGYELVRLPHTVRVPDGSFVRADRLPPAGLGPGLVKLAPDLAVEVLSPSETASALQEKLDDYEIAGTLLVWVVDPVRRAIMIVPSDARVRWLHEEDTLDGGEIVPGFTCPVADIFAGIARD